MAESCIQCSRSSWSTAAYSAASARRAWHFALDLIDRIPRVWHRIKLIESRKVVGLEAVLVQRIEFVGPKEDRLEYGDLLTDHGDQIARLDVELLQRVAVALIHRIYLGQYRLAARVGYQTMNR